MFPDPDSEWEDYPSLIDGIENPFVRVLGGLCAKLSLLVLGNETNASAYGVSASIRPYFVVDEFEYSITKHSIPVYEGGAYIRRARRSKLLRKFRASSEGMLEGIEHYAFVGCDDCVEFIAESDPHIVPLASEVERRKWVSKVCDDVRGINST